MPPGQSPCPTASPCSWKTSLMLWLDGSSCKRDLEGEGSIWLSGLRAGSPGLGRTGTGQMPLELQGPYSLEPSRLGTMPGKTWVSPLGGPTWCPGGGQVAAHCPRKRPPAPGEGAGPRGKPGSAQNRAPASVRGTQTGSEWGPCWLDTPPSDRVLGGGQKALHDHSDVRAGLVADAVTTGLPKSSRK